MPETLCQQLAAGLHGLNVASVPADVMHGAKRALLDALGAALAGCDTVEVDAVLRAALAVGGQGPVSVWGTTLKLNAAHAALVNGTAVHAREVDDFGGCGHSGAVVMPAAFAAAELRDVSGSEFLVAIVAGYEAAARVINFAGGYAAHNAVGWHGTGTCGVFGAAAAAAKALKLSSGQTSHAIGLAGTYTGGIWSFITDGAMSKRVHAGKAAEGGLVAALLAQQGVTGPEHLFEPGWGSFVSLYAGANADPDALLGGFDKPNLIFNSGFKPYACCRGCHSSLDAVLQLRSEHGFNLSSVDRIVVRASEHTARQLGKQDVANVLDAQMSLPYSLAVLLRHGRADLEHYQPPHLDDPQLAAVARNISVVAEPRRTTGSEPLVELHLADGRTLSATVEKAKGEHANPMTDEELRQKFFALAALHIDRDRAAAIDAMVFGLERLSSIKPLVDLLKVGGKVDRRHDALHSATAL